MKPSTEDLQRQVAALLQDLSFARDNASQFKMKYEEAKKTLRDEMAMAALAWFERDNYVEDAADLAYALADEMLQRRTVTE
jgi:hypothetical protein